MTLKRNITLKFHIYGECHIEYSEIILKCTRDIISIYAQNSINQEEISHLSKSVQNIESRISNRVKEFYQSFNFEAKQTEKERMLFIEGIDRHKNYFGMRGIENDIFRPNNIFTLDPKDYKIKLDDTATKNYKKMIKWIESKKELYANIKFRDKLQKQAEELKLVKLFSEEEDIHSYRESHWMEIIKEETSEKIRDYPKVDNFSIFIIVGKKHSEEGPFFGKNLLHDAFKNKINKLLKRELTECNLNCIVQRDNMDMSDVIKELTQIKNKVIQSRIIKN